MDTQCRDKKIRHFKVIIILLFPVIQFVYKSFVLIAHPVKCKNFFQFYCYCSVTVSTLGAHGTGA